MHDTAILNGKRFFDTYVSRMDLVTVLDIGAQDVNGSLKQVCPTNGKYVAVDFVEGRGVDVVLKDPYKLPFDDGSAEIVVSSSCFEHVEMFWVLFLEILRVLKPSGLFYLNAPSNGVFHRYPVDCWRFYPDSGSALAKWARANGYNTALLECYTSNQREDIWNDCVCVFIKDIDCAHLHPNRILASLSDFTNGVMHPQGGLINEIPEPEDQRLLGWRLHKRLKLMKLR